MLIGVEDGLDGGDGFTKCPGCGSVDVEGPDVRAADIAEYNPSLDQDKRTARAAARLAHRLL